MPEDGAEVSPASTEEMWVQFSNNVAEATVADGNIEKISLTHSDGTPVDVDVFVADTQTEPDKRTYLYISPAGQLEPGAYVITVKAGITAKNGISSDADETISFTVADAAGTASSADAAAAPASSASTAASASPASSAAASSGAGEESSRQGAVPVAAVVVVVIVAAVCIAAALRFRKKKNDSRASDDTAEDATPKDTKSE